MPMPTDYSGNPVPPKQYYLCPHCKEQSPLTKEWVGLTDDEVRQMCGSVPSMREAVREAEAKLKEKNT
jgi:hypothetical protein